MICKHCDKKAIISEPSLCSDHFDKFMLETVKETIDKFNLFSKDSNILVAVSGGKDSLALIDILLRLGYSVTGLFIDEGIKNYREHSIEDLDFFSSQKNFKVLKHSFKTEFGFTLDSAILTKQLHACTICGTLRRHSLNKFSQGFDVIATGHNLDDESQTILMNIARGNTDLFLRLGPISKESDVFTQRVKPFFYLTEKQILVYTLVRNIRVHYGECPYAYSSYRAFLRDELNKEEESSFGTKRNIVDSYLALKESISTNSSSAQLVVEKCSICQQPSKNLVCKACKIQQQIKEKL